jgi:hypothetical protein
MAEGDTGINVLLGAVATVLLGGVVPFAPVLGGALSGYLHGGDRSDGLRVGLYAGLVAMIPLFLLFMFVGSVMFAVMAGGMGTGMPMAVPGFAGGLLVVGFVFVAIYTVGLSALGGWLGNYLKTDTDL